MMSLFVIAALATSSISAQTPHKETPQLQPQPQPQVVFESQIFVENTVTTIRERVVRLEPASTAVPGDIIIYKLLYSNPAAQPAADFSVKYPVPQGLVFVGTDSPEASVSVDGGDTFGAISTLSVSKAGVTRPARPADVTHIRYLISDPVPSGAKGELSFRGRAK